ncbi:MAG TPA: YfhO family protein, partial [Candidatus Bathyarchaeia archaeon]|nr:YfhO family protein [Candidatus Bathyarchaeia archaeon]
DFSFSKTVILEKDLPQEFEEPKVQRLQLIQDEDQKLVVKTQTEKDSILVIADSFYPGWQAKIDNKKIVLFPANLNQRALILPQGNHTIELKYYPRKFFAGVAITAGASILFIALILAKKSVFFLE